MVERRWPKGISPDGGAIRIRFQHRGVTYSEQIPGNIHNPRDIAQAQKRLDQLRTRVKAGLSIDGLTSGNLTFFSDDCQDYLDTIDGDIDESTALNYANIINRHWLPQFQNSVSQDISTRQIKEYLASIKVSKKTKRNILSVLRGVLDHAEVNPNPADALTIRTRKSEKTKVHRHRPEQRTAIMQELDKLGDLQASCYFALLYGAGLRPGGEPLGLQWPDWQEPYLHVHRTIVRRKYKSTTKTHEERKVFVPEWVRPYINALPSRFKHESLFLNSLNTPMLDADDMNKIWSKVFEAQKIKVKLKMVKQRPYICRHTRAAELLSIGTDPARAARQLGHSLEMFYRTYSEWIDEYSSDKVDDSDLEGVGIKEVKAK